MKTLTKRDVFRILLVLLALVLAGCGSDDTGGTPSITPSISAAQTSAILEAKAATEALDRINRLGLQWKYGSSVDDMTSKTSKFAVVHSLNEVSFGFPYEGPQRATLTLRVHPRYGKDVILQVERGQFLCHSDDCRLMIRYDDGRAWEYTGAAPADGSSTSVFIHDYNDIVKSLRSSKHLRIEASFYQQGSPVFEFDTSKLDW